MNGSFARLVLGDGPMRFLTELDGEVSPTRLRRETRIDPMLPPLPTWSVGGSLGAEWAGP